MSDTPSKKQRMAMLGALKARQRAAAEAALPLPKADLAALFDHLDVELGRVSCDDTLRLSAAFLAARGLDVARVTTWLRASGAGCDCEVLANVEEQWEGQL